MPDQPKSDLPVRSRIAGMYWRTRHRAENRILDACAVLSGYCNDSPWRPDPGEGGGYVFWRCALKRGHEGLHRSRNYVWTDDGRTDYVPVPLRREMPSQPWTRKGIPTLRQQRARNRWHERQQTARRTARGGDDA